jgi:hypothetical protein
MADVNWSERSSISAVGTTGTSGALSGDIIDMASNGGFNSVMFVAYQSASQADAQLIVQMGSASDSLSDATGNVLGTKTTLYYDLHRPVHRFVRGILEPGSATIAFEALVTIPYNARKLPTTQPASTTGLAVYSPGSGTASG